MRSNFKINIAALCVGARAIGKYSLAKLCRKRRIFVPDNRVESAVNRFLISTALLLLLPGAVAAAPSLNTFEQRCEREMRAMIEVRAHRPGFVVHNTVSSRLLNNRGFYNVAGQVMMGMTASSTRAEIDIDGPALIDTASGRECIAPRITVDLTYQPLDVYVAREFHPASCSYRAVYEHEMRHVDLYTDNLPRIENLVRAELIQRYGGRPLYAARNQGLALLHAQIDSWLRPLIKIELAKVEIQQHALDGADETERLSHSCMGEIANAMGSSF